MFSRLATADMMVIGRGLLLLVAIIMFGVSMAETQLNTLTQRQEFVQVANIRRDADGTYGAFILGQGVTVNALYPVGRLKNDNRTVMLEIADSRLVVPTMIYIDISKVNEVWGVWSKQFAEEAWRTKYILQSYLLALAPFVMALYQQLSDMASQLIIYLMTYLRQYM